MPSPDLLLVLALGLRDVDLFTRIGRDFGPMKEAVVAGSVFLLILYGVLDLVRHAEGDRAGKTVYRARMGIVAALVGLLVVLPAVKWMSSRPYRAPVATVHDGLVGTEDAMHFFLQGRNPYVETYEGTPMGQWPYMEGPNRAPNPAVYHLAYGPLTFLLPIPFYAASRVTAALLGAGPWWDGRVVLLLAWIGLTIAGALIGRTREQRLILAALLGLNPFLLFHTVWGENEALVLLWIALTAGALLAGRERRAGIWLGLACATKGTAWPLALFYLARLYGQAEGDARLRLRRTARRALPFIVTFALLVGPFLLWNAHAFIEDVWTFPAGGTTPNYPIKGPGAFGFGSLVLLLGWAQPHDRFPFLIFQALFGLPLLAYLLRAQQRRNTVAVMLFAFALWELVWLYFSRFLHDNYLGLLFGVMVLAWGAGAAGKEERGQGAG